MKIQIVQDHHLPISKQVKDNTYYSQKAYIHQGGAFPQEFLVPLDAPINAYPVGFYEINPESYQVNQYGSLELNRFKLNLTPISTPNNNK